MRRRFAASASRACVSAFSSARSSSRAAFHSCGETTLGKFMSAEIRGAGEIHRRWIPAARRIPTNANERRTGMGKIVVTELVSLDGVVEDPTGEEGFARGGWFGEVGEKDRDERAKIMLDDALGAEAFMLGRRT